MTDLKNTGLVFSQHEIIEIGLVVFESATGKIHDTLDIKV